MTMMLPKGPAPAEKRPSVPFGSRNIAIIAEKRTGPLLRSSTRTPTPGSCCQRTPRAVLSDGERLYLTAGTSICRKVPLPDGRCLAT